MEHAPASSASARRKIEPAIFDMLGPGERRNGRVTGHGTTGTRGVKCLTRLAILLLVPVRPSQRFFASLRVGQLNVNPVGCTCAARSR